MFTKVGKAIRALRQAKEYTLEDLAERASPSPQPLIEIEYGRTNTSLASLAGIAKGLGVRLRDLFDTV